MPFSPPLISPQLIAKRDQLLTLIKSYGSCAVAFSGGVDSAVVAKAACLALANAAVAVTADSPSLASGELDAAREVAALIGIRHEVLPTGEMAKDEYRRNAPDRCYHCKTELYSQLAPLAKRLGAAVIVNGANVDDQGDYRPGMIAAAEREVKSPLLECGVTKGEVRRLAAVWDLPVWDKPAAPCLSSRVAYGVEVTPRRLAMIDAAEKFLRESLGLRELRVRCHEGNLARIEVPLDNLAQLTSEDTATRIAARFREIGFAHVTLDLRGFRSGSLNEAMLAGGSQEVPSTNELVQLRMD